MFDQGSMVEELSAISYQLSAIGYQLSAELTDE
jgi:hypothetical protein